MRKAELDLGGCCALVAAEMWMRPVASPHVELDAFFSRCLTHRTLRPSERNASECIYGERRVAIGVSATHIE